jgi:prepilin peptidase CpaA
MSLVLSLWLAGLVASDFGWRRANNRWLLAGAAVALAAFVTGRALPGVTPGDALVTGSAAFALGLVFYASRLLHAGDVKCLAVMGLWLGSGPLLTVVTTAGLMAGVHSVLWLALRCVPRPLTTHPLAQAPARWLTHPDLGRIPYAGYLALAALLWLAGHAVSLDLSA